MYLPTAIFVEKFFNESRVDVKIGKLSKETGIDSQKTRVPSLDLFFGMSGTISNHKIAFYRYL